MRRFHERIVTLGDYIADNHNNPAKLKKIKNLSDGISLDSQVKISWVVGSVRNTLYSIREVEV